MVKTVATSFLQAVVVIIPVWLATSQFLVQRFASDDGLMAYDGSWNDIVLFIFSSYVTLAIALLGVYISLEPLSFGVHISFAALITWIALTAVFLISSVTNSRTLNEEDIENAGSTWQNPIIRGGTTTLLSIGGVAVCLWTYSIF